MNKFQSLLLSVIAVMAFTFTACETTDDTPDPAVPPTAFFSTGTDLVTDADTVQPLEAFTVEFNASKGNSALVSYSIYEDGVKIDDLNRITVDGALANANPALLFNADTSSFTKRISVLAHAEFSTVRTYTFEVMDANGETSAIAVDITTFEEVVTTPLDTTYVGTFFSNADNARPEGGFDLSAGAAVSVSSPDADLQDKGIDNGPVASNWLQKFGSANGAVLKTPAVGFDYDGSDNKEALLVAYDLGTEVNETPEKVQAGDVYLVKADETIYAIKITDVTITAADNDDKYTLDVKF